jgi:signal transduction histidine kinase
MSTSPSRRLPALSLPATPVAAAAQHAEALEQAEPAHRKRQGLLLALAGAVLACAPLDVLLETPAPERTLAVRLLWATLLASTALLPRPFYARHRRGVLAVLSLACSGLYLTLVVTSGGVSSPYFQLLLLMPPLMALLSYEVPATVVSGVVGAAGMAGLLTGTGSSPQYALGWVGLMACITFFATWCAQQVLRVRLTESQVRLERARGEALQQLALSEHRRAQSEKLALLGKLAASVVHEINNPLAYLRSNLFFLQEQLALPAAQCDRHEVEQVLEEMRTGLERLQCIVADLRGYARVEGGDEPTECSLADVVGDAARLASLKLRHVARLEVEVPAHLPPVHAVRRRLTQVLLNLLVNAGEALEEAGSSQGRVWVHGRVEGERALLRL